MTSENVEFVRLVGTERRVGHTLSAVSRHWQGDKERFLFISPHDDDAVLGAGLFMQLALRERVPVQLLIVTDGAMGYCSEADRGCISDIRRRETSAAYKHLGLEDQDIHWMGFPDCQLTRYQGRREADPGDPAAVAGFTGLQNALTFHLRRVRPTQVFVPTFMDLHPDHQIVHRELLISLFHAAGEIWPELGPPLTPVPHVHEMAVYCDFPTLPAMRVRTPAEYLTCKLESVALFKSQRQIAATVQSIAAAGPEEYFRPVDMMMYHPLKYRTLFDGMPALRAMH